MSRQVHAYKQRLDNLFKKIESFQGDEELRAALARHLCVLVSGFLEVSVREIYGEYAQNKAAENVANYVTAELKSFQNPKMEKILNLTQSFSPNWKDNLEKATEGEIKDSVDSIVANRNIIAHGRSVGITIGNIKRYYKNAVKLVGLIETQCNQYGIAAL